MSTLFPHIPKIQPFSPGSEPWITVSSEVENASGARQQRGRYPDAPDRLWTRLACPGMEEVAERVVGFRPGGYFPINLHDKLHHGQYSVIGKLGYSYDSTVWLCRDLQAQLHSYVAIKAFKANRTEEAERVELALVSHMLEQSKDQIPFGENIALPLKHFIDHSPSGAHMCFVFPVFGLTVNQAEAAFRHRDDKNELLREVSRQATGALAALHSLGVCHGDFRPKKLLLGLRDLNGMEEEDVHELLLCDDSTQDILIMTDVSHTPEEIPFAPKHLVCSIDLQDIEDRSAILPQARLIDFSHAFTTVEKPVPSTIIAPEDYLAPEIVLGNTLTKAMDLWALGCTIYEIRLGESLFDPGWSNSSRLRKYARARRIYIDDRAKFLGERPPEHWEEDEDEDEEEDDYSTEDESGSEDSGLSAGDEDEDDRVSSILEALATSHPDCHFRCPYCESVGTDDRVYTGPRFPVISEPEARALADLLEKLLRWRPEERLSAEDALKHPWFHTEY